MAQRAAASANFNPTDEEFHSLLKDRPELLKELTLSDGRRLVFLRCLEDYFGSLADTKGYSDADCAESTFDRRLETLKGAQREHEIRELKIYHLAKNAVPWKGGTQLNNLPDALKFLTEKIVEGDTWATYKAFYAALQGKRHDRHLPFLWGRIEPDKEVLEDEEEEDPGRTPDLRVNDHPLLPQWWLQWVLIAVAVPIVGLVLWFWWLISRR